MGVPDLDLDGPSGKKRRFFTEPSEPTIGPSQLLSPLSSSPPPKRRHCVHQDSFHVKTNPDASGLDTTATTASIPPSTSPTRRSPIVERDGDDASNRTSTPSASNIPPSAPIQFDQDTFESFVGEKVNPEIIDIIREKCANDIERAVNMYLDGTWKGFKKKPSVVGFQAAIPQSKSSSAAAQENNQAHTPPAPLKNTPRSRYVGAFGVEGWATRSGTNLLKHGDIVKIERQKIQPPQSTIKMKNKLGASVVVQQRVSPAVARRVDVIVRFTTQSGMELGRLAKETADWISTLMDQKVAEFEGTCVYAPERLRTNDTVFIQLRCSLLATAFSGRGFQLPDNRNAGIFEQNETEEERSLRLRQVALVKLFQEINLMPVQRSAAAAKTQRQQLLEAAEMADKKAKEAPKSSDSDNPPSSPPSDENENEDGQELEQDQLDSLYKKAQSFDFLTPEAEPADTFAMTLRPYQKQALYWMMSKEKDQRNEHREVSMHPLWEEYVWPTKDHDDKDLPRVADQPNFYLNPYSGDMSLEFPVQEQRCLGGILADEMGLGKTIQMLSLIHSHRSDVADEARRLLNKGNAASRLARPLSSSADVVNAPCTTLVVAPMSLLAQWHSEAERASKQGTLKSIVYYGNEKSANLQTTCCAANAATAPDVIITSYGVVLSEFSQIASKKGDRTSHNGLFSLNFFRVILDEAHTIKNRQSKTARACYEISAEHRWALTGTPIVNRLEDLFSLVRFLRVEPWNNFSFWRTFITVPFESKDFMRALDVVQTVLGPLVMRRTKDMKTPDGQPLVPLPPKEIEIVDVELSEAERNVYDYVFMRAKRSFQANVEAGTVMKAFTSIFAQILRLRQCCCHPVLVRNPDIVADEEAAGALADAAAGLADDMDLHSLIEKFTATTTDDDSNAFGAHVLKQIRDEAANECPICAEEPMIEQTVTGCWHSACKKCLLDYIKHQTDRHEPPRCFQCRQVINPVDLFEVVREDEGPPPAVLTQTATPPRISLQRLGVNNSSAKVVELIKHLRALRREHPTMKSVVFSQFTSFLTLIEGALDRAKMKFLRLDGTMAQKARAAVLTEFRESEQFTVLLISLRAGGVGLNLTSAKRVYMMDPWWSFAVEAQAIDRVHRMGQDGEVKVYRFIVRDSVEERMLRVQERKKFIATSLGMMSDEEKRVQRIEDIKELLS